jgi:hypothetical protein
MTDVPPVHDFSRVDAFTASRRRTAFLHAIWKPMLAGAAGAALVIAAVWVTLPKISYREIEIPRVAMRDVEVPRITTHDVTIDIPKVITHEVNIPAPVASLPPRAPDAAERKFVDSPTYKNAPLHGRIVGTDGDRGFRFDDGKTFHPVSDSLRDDVSGLIGDYAFCTPLKNQPGQYACEAIHNDVTQLIPMEPAS